jgi:hypothetical protein
MCADLRSVAASEMKQVPPAEAVKEIVKSAKG